MAIEQKNIHIKLIGWMLTCILLYSAHVVFQPIEFNVLAPFTVSLLWVKWECHDVFPFYNLPVGVGEALEMQNYVRAMGSRASVLVMAYLVHELVYLQSLLLPKGLFLPTLYFSKCVVAFWGYIFAAYLLSYGRFEPEMPFLYAIFQAHRLGKSYLKERRSVNG